MIGGLVVVGIRSHSLGVLASGGDYLADAAAIVLGLIAIRVSRHPHGHPKATGFVAMINALLLLIASIFVIIEATRRLRHRTPEIHGFAAMVISIIATIAMIISALVLKDTDNKEADDLHMRSVMLDTISDAAASAAVAVAGGIILATGRFYWIDSALAALIASIVGYHALKLIRVVLTELRTTDTTSGTTATGPTGPS